MWFFFFLSSTVVTLWTLLAAAFATRDSSFPPIKVNLIAFSPAFSNPLPLVHHWLVLYFCSVLFFSALFLFSSFSSSSFASLTFFLFREAGFINVTLGKNLR